MDGRDPRSAALHRNRLHEDKNRGFAQEAMAKRELLVGREDTALQAALTEMRAFKIVGGDHAAAVVALWSSLAGRKPGWR